MRRRGRTILMGYRTPSQPHSTSGPAECPTETPLAVSEVPEDWRKHAREPWRILFLDLDWVPPSQDD